MTSQVDQLVLSTNPEVVAKLEALKRELFIAAETPLQKAAHVLLYWLLYRGETLDRERMYSYLLQNHNRQLSRAVFEEAWGWIVRVNRG